MSRLPVCSGAEVIRAFERAGWTRQRQRGSHVTLAKPGHPVVLTVPFHSTIGPGLLQSLIRKANLTVEEFTKLL
jgi:predicted RNA binding protein YcfA (HicA-like mRNA interferase family)